MAINQIVPPDFVYSFAPEVNTGAPVSWQGDRPWNVVLKQALEPAGLMLGTDKSRSYCLEMICADFLAGAIFREEQP